MSLVTATFEAPLKQTIWFVPVKLANLESTSKWTIELVPLNPTHAYWSLFI